MLSIEHMSVAYDGIQMHEAYSKHGPTSDVKGSFVTYGSLNSFVDDIINMYFKAELRIHSHT